MVTRIEKLTEEELGPFCHSINQRYGLIFRSERNDDIRAALKKRMTVCHILHFNDYLEYIQSRETEFLSLINLLTVNETYFFREPAHLKIVAKHLVCDLLLRSNNKPFLTLLSAGCSTGEEAYSLAMTLLEVAGVGREWDFYILGVDVDVSAIQKAQEGIFSSYSFRACSEDVKLRYFEPMAEGNFRIKSAVREKVKFEVVNLFAPIYPDAMQQMDIIFYRNVSIYFSKERQKELFSRLAGLLADEGCLFVSSTETLYHNTGLLSLVETNAAFYYQKSKALKSNGQYKILQPSNLGNRPISTVEQALKAKAVDTINKLCQTNSPALTTDKPRPVGMASSDSQGFDNILEMARTKKYEEALALLDGLIEAEPSCIKAYNFKAGILLNQQQAIAAIGICQKVLSMDSFSLEAFLLLGMAARMLGQMDEALRRFKEAVYLQPDCWLAHFYLAEIFQLRQEIVLSRREYEIVRKIINKGHIEKHGLTFFPVAFQAEHFLRLCQHHLKELDETTGG